MDISSLPTVQHDCLDLLRWRDDNGTIKKLKIYDKIAHKWNRIATRLGFEPVQIDSIQSNYPFSDYNKTTAVFRVWFENANGLPNADRYPKSWQGLINLLEDSELSEVGAKLYTALSSPKNSVRKNL